MFPSLFGPKSKHTGTDTMMDGALKPAMATHLRTSHTPKEAITAACFIEHSMGIGAISSTTRCIKYYSLQGVYTYICPLILGKSV